MAKKLNTVENNIKKSLVELIMQEENIPHDDSNFNEWFSKIWHNPNKRAGTGLRLTTEGLTALKEILKLDSYEIKYPADHSFITNQIAIWADRYIDCPFYLGKKSVIVFGERMAVQLVLFGGDLYHYGLCKSGKQERQKK